MQKVEKVMAWSHKVGLHLAVRQVRLERVSGFSTIGSVYDMLVLKD